MNNFFTKLFKKDNEKILIDKLIEKHLPKKKLNYNISHSLFSDYKREFLDTYLYDILPLALRKVNITNDFPKILDIGCGFGPMCLASKIYRDLWLKNKKLNDQIYYVGLDIREDSIRYNKKNFSEYNEIIFVHHETTNSKVDYIGNFDKFKIRSTNYTKTEESSDGAEGKYNLKFEFESDIQWSNSLITHVTPQTLDNILVFIHKHLSSDGISLNTCNVIDPESLYLMKTGIADRNLIYDFGPFMTYSNKNPLLNTAYKVDYLNEVYKKNRLEITEIIPGNWRYLNRPNNQNYIYLDTIVARKF